MIVAIHQPSYLPWLGLIDKAKVCDVFVFMDDAQYTSGSSFDYNEIRTPQGKMRLKVPVKYRFGNSLNEVRTNDKIPWKELHKKALHMNYANAGHYNEVMPAIAEVLNTNHESLAVLNEDITLRLFGLFGIYPEIVLSSSLGITTKKEQRVIDICKAVGADEYVSGLGAASYQHENNFNKNGIRLTYSRFVPKPYKQMFGGFVPNLSSIDYLMNCGGVI